MLKPQLIRKKSVRECTCKTTELREEEEELTMLEPEKLSEKNNGTTDLSLTLIEENGTDYAGKSYWDEEYDVNPRDKCNTKTQSWSDPPGMCLDKCSKNKKCPTKSSCQKICLYENDGIEDLILLLRKEASQNLWLSSLGEKELHKEVCKIRSWVLLRGSTCHPKCKKDSDCKKIPRKNGKNGKIGKNVRCESVCV